MSGAPQRIVIIGAGQAGGQAAYSLRLGGFAGEITLVGDEPAPPYQRPPLSKAYLKGELEAERLFLKPLEYYAEHRVELITGDAATAIDLDRRQTVDAGERAAARVGQAGDRDRRAAAQAVAAGRGPEGRQRIAHAGRCRP